ncbi:MAG: DUF3987 domain-containing protein [Pirellulales bacterium]|nr:DUF3987 domain-containing protein [Pirellulales bacterium]
MSFTAQFARGNGKCADTISENAEKTAIVSTVSSNYKLFPLGVFPEPVRTYITEAAKSIGVAVEFIALPILSALAAAVGLAYRICLKSDWTEPSVIWTGVVAESGTGKTPAQKAALWPLELHERQAIQRFEQERFEYEAEKTRFDAAMTDWKRTGGKDGLPPIEPIPPICKRYIVNDITVESLAVKLRDNPKGLLFNADELSAIFAQFTRYKGRGQGSDVSNYLSMFNAGSLRVDRKTGDSKFIYIPHAAVSMTGGIQPKILSRLKTTEYTENGFFARLLLASPPRQPHRWSEDEISSEAKRSIQQLFDGLLGLAVRTDDRGDIIPIDVHLNAPAKHTFIRFVNAHAKQQHQETAGELAAVWSKLECYAARIALVFHMVRVVAGDSELLDIDRVDATDIQSGIELVEWFKNETRRIYAILGETEEEGEARELIELITQRGGEITTRDLMRASRKYRVAEDAEAVLTSLAERDWGAWYVREHDGAGRPVSVFRLNPDADVDTIRGFLAKTAIVSAHGQAKDRVAVVREGGRA